MKAPDILEKYSCESKNYIATFVIKRYDGMLPDWQYFVYITQKSSNEVREILKMDKTSDVLLEWKNDKQLNIFFPSDAIIEKWTNTVWFGHPQDNNLEKVRNSIYERPSKNGAFIKASGGCVLN